MVIAQGKSRWELPLPKKHLNVSSKCAYHSNPSEKVKTFKYLGSLLINQTSIQEEIKCRLKAGNSWYFSVQTLLSFRLLSKNLIIKIYETIILPVVSCGCETWSITLREKSRINVFENRILTNIWAQKGW